MAKKPQKRWNYSPKSAPKPKVPETTKQSVQEAGDKLLEEVLKPQHIIPPPEDNILNYIVDLHNKWYRNFFYFSATYRCPAEHCIEEFFEVKYVRLEYTGDNQYVMSYMRHTEQWQEIYYNLSLEDCLEKMRENDFFQP